MSKLKDITIKEISEKNLEEEIIYRLKNNVDVKELLLFGSYAHDVPNENSDIDLVVVLNERGISKNYDEKFLRRRKISTLFQDLRQLLAIDLLVYTIDEWKKLTALNSSFIRDIKAKGIRLI